MQSRDLHIYFTTQEDENNYVRLTEVMGAI